MDTFLSQNHIPDQLFPQKIQWRLATKGRKFFLNKFQNIGSDISPGMMDNLMLLLQLAHIFTIQYFNSSSLLNNLTEEGNRIHFIIGIIFFCIGCLGVFMMTIIDHYDIQSHQEIQMVFLQATVFAQVGSMIYYLLWILSIQDSTKSTQWLTYEMVSLFLYYYSLRQSIVKYFFQDWFYFLLIFESVILTLQNENFFIQGVVQLLFILLTLSFPIFILPKYSSSTTTSVPYKNTQKCPCRSPPQKGDVITKTSQRHSSQFAKWDLNVNSKVRRYNTKPKGDINALNFLNSQEREKWINNHSNRPIAKNDDPKIASHQSIAFSDEYLKVYNTNEQRINSEGALHLVSNATPCFSEHPDILKNSNYFPSQSLEYSLSPFSPPHSNRNRLGGSKVFGSEKSMINPLVESALSISRPMNSGEISKNIDTGQAKNCISYSSEKNKITLKKRKTRQLTFCLTERKSQKNLSIGSQTPSLTPPNFNNTYPIISIDSFGNIIHTTPGLLEKISFLNEQRDHLKKQKKRKLSDEQQYSQPKCAYSLDKNSEMQSPYFVEGSKLYCTYKNSPLQSETISQDIHNLLDTLYVQIFEFYECSKKNTLLSTFFMHDTHEQQIQPSPPFKARHATIISETSQAINKSNISFLDLPHSANIGGIQQNTQKPKPHPAQNHIIRFQNSPALQEFRRATIKNLASYNFKSNLSSNHNQYEIALPIVVKTQSHILSNQQVFSGNKLELQLDGKSFIQTFNTIPSELSDFDQTRVRRLSPHKLSILQSSNKQLSSRRLHFPSISRVTQQNSSSNIIQNTNIPAINLINNINSNNNNANILNNNVTNNSNSHSNSNSNNTNSHNISNNINNTIGYSSSSGRTEKVSLPKTNDEFFQNIYQFERPCSQNSLKAIIHLILELERDNHDTQVTYRILKSQYIQFIPKCPHCQVRNTQINPTTRSSRYSTYLTHRKYSDNCRNQVEQLSFQNVEIDIIVNPSLNQSKSLLPHLQLKKDFTANFFENVYTMYCIHEEKNRSKAEGLMVKKLFIDSFQSVSHEFGTALNCINNLSELACKQMNENDVKMMIKPIRYNSTLMQFLINDILDHHMLLQNSFVLEMLPFSLNNFRDELLDLFLLQVEYKSLSMEIHIDPQLPDIIQSDRNRIQSILMTMLRNSIKYTQQGYVRVYLKKQVVSQQQDLQGMIPEIFTLSVEVMDTGIGLEEDESHRLQQLLNYGFCNEQISKNSLGNGIGGLGVSNLIAIRLSGRNQSGINFYQNPKTKNQGTVFSFCVECTSCASYTVYSSNPNIIINNNKVSVNTNIPLDQHQMNVNTNIPLDQHKTNVNTNIPLDQHIKLPLDEGNYANHEIISQEGSFMPSPSNRKYKIPQIATNANTVYTSHKIHSMPSMRDKTQSAARISISCSPPSQINLSYQAQSLLNLQGYQSLAIYNASSITHSSQNMNNGGICQPQQSFKNIMNAQRIDQIQDEDYKVENLMNNLNYFREQNIGNSKDSQDAEHNSPLSSSRPSIIVKPVSGSSSPKLTFAANSKKSLFNISLAHANRSSDGFSSAQIPNGWPIKNVVSTHLEASNYTPSFRPNITSLQQQAINQKSQQISHMLNLAESTYQKAEVDESGLHNPMLADSFMGRVLQKKLSLPFNSFNEEQQLPVFNKNQEMRESEDSLIPKLSLKIKRQSEALSSTPNFIQKELHLQCNSAQQESELLAVGEQSQYSPSHLCNLNLENSITVQIQSPQKKKTFSGSNMIPTYTSMNNSLGINNRNTRVTFGAAIGTGVFPEDESTKFPSQKLPDVVIKGNPEQRRSASRLKYMTDSRQMEQIDEQLKCITRPLNDSIEMSQHFHFQKHTISDNHDGQMFIQEEKEETNSRIEQSSDTYNIQSLNYGHEIAEENEGIDQNKITIREKRPQFHKLTATCCVKVLCVDDEPFNLYVMKAILLSKQIHCDTALDGNDAITKFISRKKCLQCGLSSYCLIFMDLNMPVKNGFVATQEIKLYAELNRWNKITIVTCSAFIDLASKVKAHDSGSDFFIQKPINQQLLFDYIRTQFLF